MKQIEKENAESWKPDDNEIWWEWETVKLNIRASFIVNPLLPCDSFLLFLIF